jgi:hypothetical protein
LFKPKLNTTLILFLSVNYRNDGDKLLYYSHDLSIKKNNPSFYNLFFIETNNKNKFSGFKFFQFFTALYLQNIYKINLKEKNVNAISVLPRKLSKDFLFKVRNLNFKQFNIKYFNEVGYLFLVNI